MESPAGDSQWTLLGHTSVPRRQRDLTHCLSWPGSHAGVGRSNPLRPHGLSGDGVVLQKKGRVLFPKGSWAGHTHNQHRFNSPTLGSNR